MEGIFTRRRHAQGEDIRTERHRHIIETHTEGQGSKTGCLARRSLQNLCEYGGIATEGPARQEESRHVILGSELACRWSHGPVGVLTGKGAHSLGERTLRGETTMGRSQA